jgi:hypothetical protein
MARTTFTGPVVSNNGFEGPDLEASYVDITPVLDAALPAASADNQGQIRLISDSGVGENEFCLVVSTGSSWEPVTTTGGGGGTIPAGTLTVNNGIQVYLEGVGLAFWDQTKANQFKAASPSVFYYVNFDGTQTKFDGCTLGDVTSSGPYWVISTTGGSITTGLFLTGATNTRIYY